VSLKILLADDSLTAQSMGKKILTEAGYEVIAVSNGAQAMKKIVSDKPDLVVLDVYMPGYSGVELCERMRNSRETARTPVVLSVGKMEAFKPEEVTRVRADGMIVKPFEATELLAVVKKLAEKASPAPQPKREPELESVPEMVIEPEPAAVTPAPAEPEPEIQHQSVEIPQEIASTPVIGMELIPEEGQEPAASIEFEVERTPAPVEPDAGPRMSSAAGLSGVFEVEPAARPAAETPAEPAPAEEFERFAAPVEPPTKPREAHNPAAGIGTSTVEHDFMVAPPEAHEAESEFTAAPSGESFSTSAAAEPLPDVESLLEQIGHFQPAASFESTTPQSPQGLPELASWDEPEPALPAEPPQQSANPALHTSAAEVAASAPVWVAEEAEIEPDESAIPLHQQMQREAMAGGARESRSEAGPALSADASALSWEVPASFPAQPAQPPAQIPTFNQPATGPKFEPSVRTDPFEQPGSQSVNPRHAYSSPDSPPNRMEAREAQPAPEPAPAREPAHHAAEAPSEPVRQISAPTVTEAAVSPARVARIVDQLLERLKPELIDAVTRELGKKNQ
jgi:DNA-binding response OmpR family regulator